MAKNRFDYDDNAPKTKLSRENFSDALKIFQFIKPYRWSMILGMVMLAVSSLSFMVILWLCGELVNTAQGKSQIFSSLDQIGVLLVSIIAVQGVVSYFRMLLFAKVSERGIADIRLALYQKMVTLPISFFEQSRVGELSSRVTNDVERLYNTFSITLAEFLRQILILVCGIGFLLYTSFDLAKVMLFTIPIVIVGAMFFGRYIRKISKDRQNAIADTNIVLSETMLAINAVKAFTNEWFEVSRFQKANQKTVDISMSFAARRAWFAVFIVVVLFGALLFILWQGALLLQKGGIEAGSLINFFTFTATIAGSIAGLGNFYPELVGSIGATERVREILNMPSELNISATPMMPERRLEGNISFRNIRFRYPTRSDVEVLKGVSLDIKSGQKIALVGMSGAGKSTITQLLLRFYEYSEGEISVDGKNILDYNLSEYRSNMAIVPQEVLLFGGTIRENILYGKPNASDAEILEAAKLSNAWEFISQFPEGLETIVGERGIKLSGGQRQRIAIARAILRNPSILILDEATSSLDAESEKVVQDALNVLMKGRTSIIIAHRLATIRDVDQIFVLDGGKIVEQGTHDTLSMLPNGIYNGLAKLQFDAVMH
jgi:ABC-type multidrug transport system fused ATPase/permease subunit